MFCEYCTSTVNGVYRACLKNAWVGQMACSTCQSLLQADFPDAVLLWIAPSKPHCHVCANSSRPQYQKYPDTYYTCENCLVRSLNIFCAHAEIK